MLILQNTHGRSVLRIPVRGIILSRLLVEEGHQLTPQPKAESSGRIGLDYRDLFQLIVMSDSLVTSDLQ